MSKTLDKICSILPDKLYIQIKYFYRFYKFANLDNPQTYNEKLQWLKLNDHNDVYHIMADKYEVKNYVRNIIGDEYIIKTLGVWNGFNEIDFDKLPNQFVLKCTHDSGGLIICKDKKYFDMKKAEAIINDSLKNNYFFHSREWAYKDIKPRIIAEEYIDDGTGQLNDYKLFAFNGQVKALYVASDRYTKNEETKFDFFDDNFKHLELVNSHPNSKKDIAKPVNFELMKSLASKLTEGFPHIRVDFYEVNGKVYFGELTFYHMSGFQPFFPNKWDNTFGEWIDLSLIKK